METTSTDTGTQTDLITPDTDEIRKIQLEGYALTVKKARNGLFAAGIIIFISEIIISWRAAGELSPVVMGFILVESGIFIALALYTKKKPYTAIVLGLIAFTLIIILSAVVYGIQQGGVGVFKAIFSGLFVKILIFISLIRPLKDAKELQEERRPV